MRFTVLNYGATEAGKDQWAVVLDHEHVMFVGTYQQCEEWLDRHDLLADSHNSAETHSHRDLRARFALWLSSMLRGNQRRPKSSNVKADNPVCITESKSTLTTQAIMTFLRGNAGHAEALEIVAIAMLVCMTGAATASVSTAMRWERALTNNMRSTMPRCTRNATVQSPAAMTNCCETVDIACDLARSDR